MTTKLRIASAIVMVLGSTASLASAAGNEQRYVVRNVYQGPSRWGIVLVPASQVERERQPYALTGRPETRAPSRAPTIPSHARGTHGW